MRDEREGEVGETLDTHALKVHSEVHHTTTHTLSTRRDTLNAPLHDDSFACAPSNRLQQEI